ncbi:hypothetical protein PRIPAC_97520 [Pristionchus pacificus]|uniref:Uncharacterized protein n=1 Tax=Pristionchus pacificus TaxID=54126 RepID=A0A454Y6B0_PRIPA|nr:hypothetical protein PRIPAC_97520 [Pristionchus pacificus]|eukprot:PDM81622.1 hypothetical protein PRIPAC_30603 [Pristionchus pacificus]
MYPKTSSLLLFFFALLLIGITSADGQFWPDPVNCRLRNVRLPKRLGGQMVYKIRQNVMRCPYGCFGLSSEMVSAEIEVDSEGGGREWITALLVSDTSCALDFKYT